MAGHPLDRPYAGGFIGPVHHFAVRVYFEDTDVGGVVYHANYLRFMERARSDMLACVGIDQRAAHEGGEGIYAVTRADLRFVRPARLGDALVIESRVLRAHGASCAIHHRVRRDEEEVAAADVTVAFLTPAGRPRRQPKPWVEIFDHLARASMNQEESSPA